MRASHGPARTLRHGKPWLTGVAFLALAATLLSIIPCESTALGGEENGPVIAQAPMQGAQETPDSDCADNCSCLCSGSCSGALYSQTASRTFLENETRVVGLPQDLFGLLIPDSHFHPPRLRTVA